MLAITMDTDVTTFLARHNQALSIDTKGCAPEVQFKIQTSPTYQNVCEERRKLDINSSVRKMVYRSPNRSTDHQSCGILHVCLEIGIDLRRERGKANHVDLSVLP